MKGDILIIESHHRNAAEGVLKLISDNLEKAPGKYVLTVAGESGAGKSELALSLLELLKKRGINAFVFGQDDYFVYPPKTNAQKRLTDISWVGMQEVDLDLLDRTILDAVNGRFIIRKPLVDFNNDSIGEETIDLGQIQVIIAEGTYTTFLRNVDCRIFIDRNLTDTIESRKKRNREKQDDFLERILTIEHDIISKHKALADIIISRDWSVASNQLKVSHD
jgi:uridine kinase